MIVVLVLSPLLDAAAWACLAHARQGFCSCSEAYKENKLDEILGLGPEPCLNRYGVS